MALHRHAIRQRVSESGGQHACDGWHRGTPVKAKGMPAALGGMHRVTPTASPILQSRAISSAIPLAWPCTMRAGLFARLQCASNCYELCPPRLIITKPDDRPVSLDAPGGGSTGLDRKSAFVKC